MSMSQEQLAQLRALAEGATPGPWGWFGHRRGPMYLATKHHGRRFVMEFIRQGMQGAQPMFQVYDDPEHPSWGRMVEASKMAVLEVAPLDYRDDIVDIDNPDARWIAAADPTTILALIDELETLRRGR